MENLKTTLRTGVALLALAALAAAPATADQVVNDDCIIIGSQCIGQDCVNGESFGFDTLRLKENNLRMHFDDTSTSASFPRNDWRFVANDSSNGGASYLAIEDSTAGRQVFRVDAGARTNALYVKGSRVGFGTNNPVVDLHAKSGNTPTLRLEQDGTSGFAPQTWDVAGNEAGFFIRDATSGSTLPFRIRPGAKSSAIDIQADSSVEFVGEDGTGDADLHVKSAFDKDAFIGLGVSPDVSGGADAFIFGYNGAAGGADTGRAVIATRPTSAASSTDILFLISNGLEMTLSSTGLNVVDEIRVGGTPLTVPDYVFGDDYELMPLDELARFVAEQGHLPGVPSEPDIKANGLSLGGFQMRLLEKVEELTLYTLDQQQTIDELTARLAALEKQPK